MVHVNELILDLVETGHPASEAELSAIIADVAKAPFATYQARVPNSLRRLMLQLGKSLPPKLSSADIHLLKRVYEDQQWLTETTTVQYMADLHTTETLNLEKYTPDWIDMFLRNYAVLVGDAAELAGEWAEMDGQEQIHHHSIAMQSWGMRVTLGELYRAGRLAPQHVTQLTALDRALLAEATHVEIAYGLSVQQLMKSLLQWGTPLMLETGSVKLEVPIKSLPILADALAAAV